MTIPDSAAMAEPFQEIRTSYKRHEIVCTRDKPGRNWYIVVTAPSGLKCYDGCWQESSGMLPAEAVEEAKRGAMLIRPTPSQEGRSSLSVEGYEAALLGYLEAQKFLPTASHVTPAFRDGFNHALQNVIDRIQLEATLRSKHD